jgi:hypothetical protein
MQQSTSPLETFWSLDSQAVLQALSCSDNGLSNEAADDIEDGPDPLSANPNRSCSPTY